MQSSNSDEIIWYDTNEIEITQNGTYYIYAQDSVGNISQPMLLVIDELTNSEENNGNKVNVYVTQASTFSVIIPKTIILSGETKNGTYQILVKGDIGGLDSISVTPDNLLALKQYGKDDILANVTQEKTTFNYNDGMTSETPTTTNGTIVAPNMTAGSWSGSFNFNIKFNVIGMNNSIGSIKEDATSQTIVGQDQIQDKYTSYTYGIENDDLTNKN